MPDPKSPLDVRLEMRGLGALRTSFKGMVVRVRPDFAHELGVKWPGILDPLHGIAANCTACKGMHYNPATSAAINEMMAMTDLEAAQAMSDEEVEQMIAEGYFDNAKTMFDPATGTDIERPGGVTVAVARAFLGEHAEDLFAKGTPHRFGWAMMMAQRQPFFGECEACGGTGVEVPPDQREEILAWKPSYPEQGDYYQLWVDGAPMTPPCPDLRTLAVRCETDVKKELKQTIGAPAEEGFKALTQREKDPQ